MKINYHGMFGCVLGSGGYTIYTHGSLSQFLFAVILGTIVLSIFIPPKEENDKR